MKPLDTRRRQLLAAVGSVGAVATVSQVGRDFLSESPEFTYYTYAATAEQLQDEVLQVAWYEEYNGQPIERQGGGSETNASKVLDPDEDPAYVPDATGPVITFPNVLPGDSGRLVVGLRATEDVQIDLEASVTSTDNGQVEPEPNGQGELDDVIQAELWHDTGSVFGLGGCDGNRGMGDQLIEGGSLGEVLGGLDRTVVDCLEAESRRCIGFDWTFPVTAGNETQSDEVEFDLVFRARSCPE
jgi:hypothetical protein